MSGAAGWGQDGDPTPSTASEATHGSRPTGFNDRMPAWFLLRERFME